MKIIISLLILELSALRAAALMAYDCAQKFANITSFSLVDIADCDMPPPIVNTTKVEVTLLQLNEYTSTRVRYCKVKIERTAIRCGYNNHNMAVENGHISYIEEVSREDCNQMHIHKSVMVGQNLIKALVVNGTVVHSLTFAGSQDSGGGCTNVAYYNDPYGEFRWVYVTGYVSVTLQERWETVSLDKNKITLSSGTICTYNEDKCVDAVKGHAFWDPVPLHACDKIKFTNLYSGLVEKITEEGSERRPLYVLDAQEVSFAFKDLGIAPLCGFALIRTEHPKIFILEDPNRANFPAIKDKNINDIDLFSYFNAKLLFFEKHVKKSLQKLYYDVLFQQCELERKVIMNALNIATIAPDLLAYYLMNGPGYMSILAGEVVHIMKCMSVEVEARNSSKCHQELPVEFNEKPMFMAPRTHILKHFATETACDETIPVMFKVGKGWFKLLPKPTYFGDGPGVLKPQAKQSWKYLAPIDIVNSGIYSMSDIEQLRGYIMLPNEQPAILNKIARGVSGNIRSGNDVSLYNMLDEKSLERLAESAWSRFWARCISFGSVSAGFITLLMIFRLIKFMLDTVIHGYALYSLFGWSIKLVGSVWNSLTNLLVHLARTPTEERQRENQRRQADQRARESKITIRGGFPSAPPNTPDSPNSPNSPSGQGEQRKYAKDIVCKFEPSTQSVENSVVESRIYPLLQEPCIPSIPPRKKRRGREE